MSKRRNRLARLSKSGQYGGKGHNNRFTNLTVADVNTRKGGSQQKLPLTVEQKDILDEYGLPHPENRRNARRLIESLESKGWQVDGAVIRKAYELCGRKSEGKKVARMHRQVGESHERV